jgi:hypothetical protein
MKDVDILLMNPIVDFLAAKFEQYLILNEKFLDSFMLPGCHMRICCHL